MRFQTSREIAADVARVYAAFEDSGRLATWWGPAGFTNTFNFCDFRTGGTWTYVMHGPDGRDYDNECVFDEIVPPGRIVIQHVSLPRYRLAIDLAPTAAGGTLVRWDQEFEKPKVAAAIAHIVEPANEQNLDRLTEEVLRT